MIITRAPFRVSFFGGGTDYVEWFSKHGGSFLSLAIDKYAYITLRVKPSFLENDIGFLGGCKRMSQKSLKLNIL